MADPKAAVRQRMEEAHEAFVEIQAGSAPQVRRWQLWYSASPWHRPLPQLKIHFHPTSNPRQFNVWDYIGYLTTCTLEEIDTIISHETHQEGWLRELITGKSYPVINRHAIPSEMRGPEESTRRSTPAKETLTLQDLL